MAASLAVVGLGAELAAQRITDRPLMPTAIMPNEWTVPQAVTTELYPWKIATAGATPLGFEGVRGGASRVPAVRRIPIAGLTVGDALQMLVENDPRYSWNEDSGVIVVRPITAWTDKRDPLNQPIGNIAWRDITLREALNRIGEIMYGQRLPPRQESRDDRRISIRLDSGTVMDLLNGVVRTHGELMWGVTYPVGQPPMLVSRFALHFVRFDGAVFAFDHPELPLSLRDNPSRPDWQSP